MRQRPRQHLQYILENDWLDAIVQLSADQFMNTGISTYIWLLCKDKPAHRVGKVQFIDAGHCYEARRKSIVTKRNDITDACRNLIGKAYGEFRPDAVYGDADGVDFYIARRKEFSFIGTSELNFSIYGQRCRATL